ncbi:pyridoxal-dependent decarboxylase [Spongiactinospora sp. TRM90649]|uniref:pyridoxal phosphate-dependent decarboxylase family protein n=1 Tax=Spongiactinospora sp. TRM90649 TaxID=3031114 RepID=UPI0023F78768|nr:pyridoxal-dependent decarboxylase [Spongiactinospora sp. TRM90649]MDF5753260.1 pyridoxal-dependent decarboxylase [Spongiactinospora sp. TRM90649]
MVNIPPPAGSIEGLADLRVLTNAAIDVLTEVAAARTGPVAPGGPEAAREFAREVLTSPLPGRPAADPVAVFTDLVRAYAEWSVDIAHPAAVARMQCPPASVAAAAELVTATLNQSLHAWESGPFALELERHVVAELAALVGYGPQAGGTLTAGGSISNLMAVLTARDNVAHRRVGRVPFSTGLAGLGVRPVVLCTDATHFSLGRAVGIVGLGEDAIVRVPSDALGRLYPDALEHTIAGLPEDVIPAAVIACAGATDQGWVDDLPAIAEVARRHGIWSHADAAYGGGVLFSDRMRPMLAGIEEYDSVTMDLHKFGWTPASTGVFLVRESASLRHLSAAATTLNNTDDVDAGFVGLYGDSIQATRRVDALKVRATMAVLGREGLGRMVERCHELALHAARRVEAEPRLELAATPAVSTVLFRYIPRDAAGDGEVDAFTGTLRRQLMLDGRALLARSRVRRDDGTAPVYLKLMLLNPATEPGELDQVLDDVLATADKVESAALPA